MNFYWLSLWPIAVSRDIICHRISEREKISQFSCFNRKFSEMSDFHSEFSTDKPRLPEEATRVATRHDEPERLLQGKSWWQVLLHLMMNFTSREKIFANSFVLKGKLRQRRRLLKAEIIDECSWSMLPGAWLRPLGLKNLKAFFKAVLDDAAGIIVSQLLYNYREVKETSCYMKFS